MIIDPRGSVSRGLQIVLGILAMLFGSGFLLLALVTRSAEYHAILMHTFLVGGLPLLTTGALSIMRIRAATLLLAAAMFAAGIWLVLASLSVPPRGIFFNWCLGGLLMLPGILIFLQWFPNRKSRDLE